MNVKIDREVQYVLKARTPGTPVERNTFSVFRSFGVSGLGADYRVNFSPG